MTFSNLMKIVTWRSLLNAFVKDSNRRLPSIYHKHFFIEENIFKKSSIIVNVISQPSKFN